MEKAQSHPFRKAITRDEVAQLPLGHYDGPIRLVYEDAEVPVAVCELEREAVLGFDTETRAAFRKGESYPPALLQLAGEHAVYLFRLSHIQHWHGLERLLGSPHILKVGVSLQFDIRKLREVHPFDPAGFVELERVTSEIGIQNNGLRGLAAILLGIRISKGAQRTNWSHPQLTPAQVRYAATDAWACRAMYMRLREHGLLPAPRQELSP